MENCYQQRVKTKPKKVIPKFSTVIVRLVHEITLASTDNAKINNVTLTLETRVKVKTRLYAIIGAPDDPIITDADENLGISFFLLSPRC